MPSFDQSPEESLDEVPAQDEMGGSFLETALRGMPLAAGLVAILPAIIFGSIGAARNDDGIYYRLAFGIAKNGWGAVDRSIIFAFFYGQVALTWPVLQIFGSRIVPLQLFVLALGVTCLVLLRQLLAPVVEKRALLVVLVTFAFGPLFGTLAVSYMSDIPAFALQVLSLWLVTRRPKTRQIDAMMFCLAVLVTLFAYTIREYSLAATCAVFAVGIGKVVRRNELGLTAFVIAAVGWIAGFVTLTEWRKDPTGAAVPRITIPNLHHIAEALNLIWVLVFTLFVLMFPVVIWADVQRLRSKDIRTTGRKLLIGTCGGAVLTMIWRPRLQGNVFGIFGTADQTIAFGVPPEAIPSPIFRLYLSLALFAVGPSALLLVNGKFGSLRKEKATEEVDSQRDSTLLAIKMFVLAYALIMGGFALFTERLFFDRYLMPLVPLCGALLVRKRHRKHTTDTSRIQTFQWILTSAIVIHVFVGITLVSFASKFDGAKWQLGEKLLERGYSPQEIDGGYEWIEYNRTTLTNPWNKYSEVSFACVTITMEEFMPTWANARVVDRQSVAANLGPSVHLKAVSGPNSCQAPHGK